MTTRNFGAPIRRNEDARLLSGQALFVDDVELPGMLYAAFLRSNVAHARLRSIDVSAARAREGVVAVYTADDLGEYWAPGPLLVPPPPIAGIIFNQRTQVPLAKDKVRHVGEPLAVVLAQSRYLAEDALDDIAVELDPLPAVVDLEKALTDAAATVHDDVRGNVAAHVRQSRGNYAAARARADHVIARRFLYDHGASSPIETRGIVANWDARANQLTIWDTTQAPVFFRNGLAGMLGLERAAGAGDRAVCRRRLRPEDHAVLSRGGGDPVGGDKAQPPDQMDRGPARAFLRHHPRARPDP